VSLWLPPPPAVIPGRTVGDVGVGGVAGQTGLPERQKRRQQWRRPAPSLFSLVDLGDGHKPCNKCIFRAPHSNCVAKKAEISRNIRKLTCNGFGFIPFIIAKCLSLSYLFQLQGLSSFSFFLLLFRWRVLLLPPPPPPLSRAALGYWPNSLLAQRRIQLIMDARPEKSGRGVNYPE
jgi:hypothetical protein